MLNQSFILEKIWLWYIMHFLYCWIWFAYILLRIIASILITRNTGDSPGGAVVKNPPANAGDAGLSPGPGGFHMLRRNQACAPQLLSLRSRAREPQLLSPCATTTEASVPRARALQREATTMRSPRTTMKTQRSHKQTNKQTRDIHLQYYYFL